MYEFRYRALTAVGTKERGVIEADNAAQAIVSLRQRDLYPVEVTMLPSWLFYSRIFRLKDKAPSLRDLSEVCRELALLLQGSLPLNSAIRLVRRKRSGILAQILARAEVSVEQGVSFGQALQREEHLPTILWQSVRAAEIGAALPDICSELADFFDEEHRQQQKTAATLFYPKMILGCALLIVAGILSFVMPSYLNMFARSGLDLPFATKLLVFVWDIVCRYWIFLVPIALGIGKGIGMLWRTLVEQPYIDRLLLETPYVGEVITLKMMALLCRNLAMLLSAGIALERVLYSVERLPSSRTWKDALYRARMRLRSGKTLSEALSEESCFPEQLLQLISIGESSGNLDCLLRQAATYYQRQSSEKSERMNYLLQPIVMLFAAVFIGGLALALMMPLYAQLDLIQNLS